MFYSKTIKNIIKEWKVEAKVKGKILYRLHCGKNNYDDSNYILTICTNQPGPMIGKMGSLVDKYKGLINKELNRPNSDRNHVFIEFIETDEIV